MVSVPRARDAPIQAVNAEADAKADAPVQVFKRLIGPAGLRGIEAQLGAGRAFIQVAQCDELFHRVWIKEHHPGDSALGI